MPRSLLRTLLLAIECPLLGFGQQGRRVDLIAVGLEQLAFHVRRSIVQLDFEGVSSGPQPSPLTFHVFIIRHFVRNELSDVFGFDHIVKSLTTEKYGEIQSDMKLTRFH